MDWSRAKTIFIMTFLFLNMFLVFQLDKKDSANQISMITEATLQERLNEMNISIDVTLPEEKYLGVHLVGRMHRFTKEQLEDKSKQEMTIVEDTSLVSRLTEPYPLLALGTNELDAADFLRVYVYQGTQYRLGRHDREKRQLIFYQLFEEKMVHSHEEAQLVLFLDDQNRVIGYQQRLLELEEQGREQEALAALKAIEVLLNERIILANQTITDAQFGYYSFFKPLGDVYVFAPMWRITVEDEPYLVNAIEGSVQKLNNQK